MQNENIYATQVTGVDQLSVDARATFIVRTYAHLFGAILAFTGFEIFLFKSGIAEKVAGPLSQSWLLVMGAFMLVSWIGSRVAATARSKTAQYLALAAFVAMEAVVFLPLLYVAEYYVGNGVISSAAAITLTGFGVLTFIAFWTRKDFSFMGGMLRWISIGAIIAVVASLLFGFQLGTWFSVGMVLFAGAAILYDTSNVMHHFPEDRYIGASLQLFASVALMFYYVLMMLMSLTNRD